MTAAEKEAAKAMWTRIKEALPDDEMVQELCGKQLGKLEPTAAELFALDLYGAMGACCVPGEWYTAKEITNLCGVASSDASRVAPALRRLVGDCKLEKQAANDECKVCRYCLA